MTALSIIGWAFIFGCAVAAFLLPIWLVDHFFGGDGK